MFCKNCGIENDDNAAFCKNCGKQLQKTPVINVPQTNQYQQQNQYGQINPYLNYNQWSGGLKCPNCGGRRLQSIVETETNVSSQGGGFSIGKGCLGWLLLGGPLGLLCGACGSKQKTTMTQTSKSYWVCPDCGKKFRHLDELQQEIDTMKSKFSNTNLAFGILLAFCFILAAAFSDGSIETMIWMGLVFCMYPAVVLLFNILMTPTRIKNAQDELEELERNTKG